MILDGRILIEAMPLSDLYEIYHSHRRMKVFVNKGRECVTCDREGVLLLKTAGRSGQIHIDLYTKDFVLMTVDHIIPRKRAIMQGLSIEFVESLENKQPMCSPCNGWKGDKDISVEQMIAIRNQSSVRRDGPELIRKFVDNQNMFDRKLPKTLVFN